MLNRVKKCADQLFLPHGRLWWICFDFNHVYTCKSYPNRHQNIYLVPKWFDRYRSHCRFGGGFWWNWKTQFFWLEILKFKKKIVSSPWKSVKVSWVARMGQNFDDYPGFHFKTTAVKTYATQCKKMWYYCRHLFYFVEGIFDRTMSFCVM